jgi:hypothetical protein
MDVVSLDSFGFLWLALGSKAYPKSLTSMPAYHPIILRFIRKERSESPRMDDQLQIKKLGENNLRVLYVDSSEEGQLHDVIHMTYHKLFHYVTRIMWLLTVDADPFVSVQVNVPGFPVTLIPVAELQKSMMPLMDMLINTCWQWPVVADA